MTASLLGPLDYMFGEVLRLAIVVAAALGAGAVAVARVNEWSFERAARAWLFATSLATIWIFTQHNPYGGSGRLVELDPLGDLKVAVNTTGRYRDIVVANVVLFVPLGVALAWRGTRFVRAFAWGAAVSILCEVLQYASDNGRIAQSADVLVNVAGGVVGWAAFVALTGGWGPLSSREKTSPKSRVGAPAQDRSAVS